MLSFSKFHFGSAFKVYVRHCILIPFLFLFIYIGITGLRDSLKLAKFLPPIDAINVKGVDTGLKTVPLHLEKSNLKSREIQEFPDHLEASQRCK